MRTHLKLPALAIVAVLVVAACSSGTASSAPSGGASAAPAHGRARLGSAPAARRVGERRGRGPDTGTRQGVRPEHRRRTPCRCGSAPAATRAWSTSSSAPGTRRTPTKPINLSYIVHTEMVAQDRPGDRLGRRPGPDGHGPDLRPAVRECRAAGRHHGSDEGLAGAEPMSARATRPSRRSTTDCTASRCTPTCRRCSTTRTCSRRPGSIPAKPPTSLAGDPRVRRQDHGARRRHQGLLPAGQLRRLQHLHRRPADVGVGRARSRPRSAAASRSSATASSRSPSGRATWSRPRTCPTAHGPRPVPRSPSSSGRASSA